MSSLALFATWWHRVTYDVSGAQRLRHACVQLPKLLELVGLGYTAWFVYRYLLFKVRRSAWRLLIGLSLVRISCARACRVLVRTRPPGLATGL